MGDESLTNILIHYRNIKSRESEANLPLIDTDYYLIKVPNVFNDILRPGCCSLMQQQKLFFFLTLSLPGFSYQLYMYADLLSQPPAKENNNNEDNNSQQVELI